MLIRNYLMGSSGPFYAPPDETGTAQVEDTGGAPPPDDQTADDEGDEPGGLEEPASTRSRLRQQIDKSVADARLAEQPAGKESRDTNSGRFTKRGQAQEPAPAAAAPDVKDQPAAQPSVNPPDGWAKEAKAEWAKVPPTVQQAVLKREQDVSRGVEEIRRHYSEIDKAIQPRLDMIRANNTTPAQAVNHLFAWMEALNEDKNRIKAGQPPVAFQALADACGLDLKHLTPAGAQPGGEQPAAGEQPKGPVSPEIQAFINEMKAEVIQLRQGTEAGFKYFGEQFSRSSQQKTDDILANWAKGKEHFEDVRIRMSHLLASGAVPPLPNGTADLDTAYEQAIWSVPEIRAKVLASQEKTKDDARKAKELADQKAQQEEANRARRASGSLSLSAPGTPISPGPRKGKGKSIRESLVSAIEELNQ